jgi:hypothetical protein
MGRFVPKFAKRSRPFGLRLSTVTVAAFAARAIKPLA